MNRVRTLLGAALCLAAANFTAPASATADVPTTTPPTAAPAGASAAVPAKQPASTTATCPVNAICFWENTGWTGWRIAGDKVLSGNCNNLRTVGGAVLDAWSASSNITTLQRLWENPGCTGRNFLLGQGAVPDAGFGISSYGGY